MAGAGVEFRLDVPDTGVPEALDGPPDSGGALAHRVGVTGEEEKGQVLRHPGQNGGVVQPQDACEHAVVGVQGEGEHAALVGAVLVHFGLVTVEPVLRRAALEPPVIAEKGEVRHQLAAVLPAEKDGQHPAESSGCGDQRFGLEAGTHDDGSVKLIAPLAKVLPGVERAHAVAQQKIGDARIELLRQRSDSMKVVEDGAVAVGLGEIAVIRLGADRAAVAQMVVAEYLAARGILVTGHDHLGHGGSIRTKADYGYFAQPDGNRAVLDDLHAVTALTKQLYPGVPYFLLGHSMGSFYARQYLCEWGDELDGAIIMGTGFQPKALVATARTLCRVLAVFFGWEHRSKLVANLSFLGYNRGLEGRTPQDWLNRDQAEVDKYRADERCMFTFTLNAYYSMFTGILRLYDPAVLAGVPKDLPLLFLAGDADPVGERTAGVRRAIQSLRDAGVGNIESKFYPGARHELLVETNKAEVFADIAGWLNKQI